MTAALGNMGFQRLIDTERHFSKICQKPCETTIHMQACNAIVQNELNTLCAYTHKVGLGPQRKKKIRSLGRHGTFYKSRQTNRHDDTQPQKILNSSISVTQIHTVINQPDKEVSMISLF